MGTSRMNANDWSKHIGATSSKRTEEIFTQKTLHDDLNPKNFTVRESCDSVANLLSTPIILACDETGSMGIIAETLIRKGLGTVILELHERKPVPDPHVLIMGIGDCYSDKSPIQATQFESDMVLTKQLASIYIEGNGGSNNGENYNLAWYFAATRTKTDNFLKRGKKGYLFTIGDEPPYDTLEKAHIQKFMGDGEEKDISTRDLLTLVSKEWEVYHVMIEEGYYFRKNPDEVRARWRDLLGEAAISLSDHTKLAEVIVSAIQIHQGKPVAEVAKSWSGDTSLVVAKSLNSLTEKREEATGVVKL